MIILLATVLGGLGARSVLCVNSFLSFQLLTVYFPILP
jgi:hypothetical protein